MLLKRIAINNGVGLHARPVSKIAAEAQNYRSDIQVTYSGYMVSAKSSVKLLSLCVGAGQSVELICDGPDEADAMERLTEIFRAINEE